MGTAGSAPVLLLTLVIAAAAASPSPSPSSSSICNVKVSELAECIPAITGKSPRQPTKSCCSAMLKADLHCLCEYESQFRKFGVDPANALALPRKCGLKLPKDCKKKTYLG
ncbi:hypothetical protein CDL12_06763 [Handroanthus impetiginosus]|uniref:Bifunctional inhibitor/plant lipid transfer protein/seed storage helical domain-containing protein n=1 Tax=Handroanthus impetiginosus TaxID=429701 RepID=A0A2G9HSP8_9LAMI|nr:hypothetical protein CDL12_06763 [Handroanthus impetiginosus]